jgi:hypothetical protein
MGHGYPVSRRSGVPAAPPFRHVPSVTAVAAGGDLINYVALATVCAEPRPWPRDWGAPSRFPTGKPAARLSVAQATGAA